jgi:hypothetical protein
MPNASRVRIHLARTVWWRWLDKADDFERLMAPFAFARVETDSKCTVVTARLLFADAAYAAPYRRASRAGRRADVALDLLEGERCDLVAAHIMVYDTEDGFEIDLIHPRYARGPYAISHVGPPDIRRRG